MGVNAKVDLSPEEIKELRDLLEGLYRLQGWQGELLARAAALLEADVPGAGLARPGSRRRTRRPKGSSAEAGA